MSAPFILCVTCFVFLVVYEMCVQMMCGSVCEHELNSLAIIFIHASEGLFKWIKVDSVVRRQSCSLKVKTY